MLGGRVEILYKNMYSHIGSQTVHKKKGDTSTHAQGTDLEGGWSIDHGSQKQRNKTLTLAHAQTIHYTLLMCVCENRYVYMYI